MGWYETAEVVRAVGYEKEEVGVPMWSLAKPEGEKSWRGVGE